MADDAAHARGPDLDFEAEAAAAAAKNEVVHTSQLDDRMRRGDNRATPKDKLLRVLLNLLLLVAFAGLMAAFVGTVGIGPFTDLAGQSLGIGSAAVLLAGSVMLFTQIDWRALRGSSGKQVLHKAKSDLQLTMVSILALFTVAFVVVLEVGALLAFLGLFQISGFLGRASTFVLFQTMILLVYLMAIVVRQSTVSSYRPGQGAVWTSRVFSAIALGAVLVGLLLSQSIPQRLGVLTEVLPRQAIHFITLGVGLEFLAMRIRLRLPSIWSLFRGAVEEARRANPDLKEQMRNRARATYIGALVFVGLSMGFVAAMATGAVQLNGSRASLGLAIFYGGIGVIILGMVAVRMMQAPFLEKKDDDAQTELERLAGQKRASAQDIFRKSVYSVTALVAAAFLVLTVATALEYLPWHKKYATDTFLVALMFAAGPYGWFFNRDLKRIEAIDEKFPDLLRDIAESARAGMTLTRALVTASKGTYGALTDEIKQMAAQVEWGVSFGDSLERFALRTKTPLIDRTVALIVEAQRAGGNVVDILTAASDDAREIKQIVSERNEQMKMYSVVVYIAFFVFIAVVMILSSQFIPAFKEASSGADGQQVGGLQFRDFDVEDFNTLFFHAAIVQAIGGGLVGGVLTRGQPVAGFSAVLVMIGIAWVSFRVILGLM